MKPKRREMIESRQLQREEKAEMRENDKLYKELQKKRKIPT